MNNYELNICLISTATKNEFSYTAIKKILDKAHMNLFLILLNSEATKNVFCNQKLLRNLNPFLIFFSTK